MSQTTDPGNDAPSLSFLLEEVGRRFAALQAENATLRKALQAAEHLQVASADDLTETRARLEISDQAAITSEKENITTQAAAQAAAATSCSDHLASE
jgi:hypothetical protein